MNEIFIYQTHDNQTQIEVIPNKNIIYTNFDNWFFYVIFGLYYISYYGACENFGY